MKTHLISKDNKSTLCGLPGNRAGLFITSTPERFLDHIEEYLDGNRNTPPCGKCVVAYKAEGRTGR